MGVLGAGHQLPARDEAVDDARVAGDHGRDTGVGETSRVRLALVAQGVELGGQHPRRRESGEVVGSGRHGERVRPLIVGHELRPEPRHVGRGQEVPRRVVGHRRVCLLPIVDARVDECLQREPETLVACAQRDPRREVAAG